MTLAMKYAKGVIVKDADGDGDDDGPGEFHIILSTPDQDRDGEELKSDEWEPLPDHITMDIDHGMSVASTVGSGTPKIEDDGNMHVRGTYSSTPLAQETRTKVNEGHIRTTSVAFIRKTGADAKSAGKVSRELLNGAFVAVPANPNAAVLSGKGFSAIARTVDEGAVRSKAVVKGRKSIQGSIEALRDRVTDAVCAEGGRDVWVLTQGVIADKDDGGTVVFTVYDFASDGPPATYRQSYTDDGQVVTLSGEPEVVDLLEVVVPRSASDGSAAADSDKAAAAAHKAAAAAEDESAAAEVRARAKAAAAAAAAIDTDEE